MQGEFNAFNATNSLENAIEAAKLQAQNFAATLLESKAQEANAFQTLEKERVQWRSSYEEKTVLIEQLERELASTVQALTEKNEQSRAHTAAVTRQLSPGRNGTNHMPVTVPPSNPMDGRLYQEYDPIDNFADGGNNVSQQHNYVHSSPDSSVPAPSPFIQKFTPSEEPVFAKSRASRNPYLPHGQSHPHGQHGQSQSQEHMPLHRSTESVMDKVNVLTNQLTRVSEERDFLRQSVTDSDGLMQFRDAQMVEYEKEIKLRDEKEKELKSIISDLQAQLDASKAEAVLAASDRHAMKTANEVLEKRLEMLESAQHKLTIATSVSQTDKELFYKASNLMGGINTINSPKTNEISTDSLTEKLAHLSDVEQEVTDTKQINRHMHDELQALKLDRDITNEKLEFSVNNNNILRLELQELKMQQLEMIKDLQKPKVEMVVDVAQSDVCVSAAGPALNSAFKSPFNTVPVSALSGPALAFSTQSAPASSLRLITSETPPLPPGPENGNEIEAYALQTAHTDIDESNHQSDNEEDDDLGRIYMSDDDSVSMEGLQVPSSSPTPTATSTSPAVTAKTTGVVKKKKKSVLKTPVGIADSILNVKTQVRSNPSPSSTPKSNKATPRSSNIAPRSSNATPRSSNIAPRSSNATPRSSNTTPRSSNTTPRSSSTTPRSSSTTPRSSNTTPRSSMVHCTPISDGGSESPGGVLVLASATSAQHTPKASTALVLGTGKPPSSGSSVMLLSDASPSVPVQVTAKKTSQPVNTRKPKPGVGVPTATTSSKQKLSAAPGKSNMSSKSGLSSETFPMARKDPVTRKERIPLSTQPKKIVKK